MKNRIPIQHTIMGYTLLIALAVVQQLVVFWNVYIQQHYGWLEILVSAGTLLALMAGFLLPRGTTVVVSFVLLVSCFVMQITGASVSGLGFFEALLVPVNMLVASLIRYGLIHTRRLARRLSELEQLAPQIDVDTGLGSKHALAVELAKQSNLAQKYPEQYTFGMAMFKIEFLPFIQEAVGPEGYARLLLTLSDTIQAQIRSEDYSFALDQRKFVILCPMAVRDSLELLTRRIQHAIMNVPCQDKKGNELQLVVRTGMFIYGRERYVDGECADGVIAALERKAETDLIGEYI